MSRDVYNETIRGEYKLIVGLLHTEVFVYVESKVKNANYCTALQTGGFLLAMFKVELVREERKTKLFRAFITGTN